MPATVLLTDIIEALEMQFDELPSFLDVDTGQVATVSRELLRAAEEDDSEAPDLPAWQEREWEIVRRVVSTDRFERLPTQYDVHEWAIMQDFALSVESADIREELLDALHGAGAFRCFKDTVRQRGIQPAWHAFRTEALRQIAIDWCEDHDIQWR
jgi:hypothetical protein